MKDYLFAFFCGVAGALSIAVLVGYYTWAWYVENHITEPEKVITVQIKGQVCEHTSPVREPTDEEVFSGMSGE